MKKHDPGMRITQGKGFQMTFANGFTASVQFGWQNYCENRNVNTYESDATECESAEVAFWYDGGELRSLPEWSDTVRGWLSADEVLEFLNTVADMREDEETIPTEGESKSMEEFLEEFDQLMKDRDMSLAWLFDEKDYEAGRSAIEKATAHLKDLRAVLEHERLHLAAVLEHERLHLKEIGLPWPSSKRVIR